jgi:hypothetical protein
MNETFIKCKCGGLVLEVESFAGGRCKKCYKIEFDKKTIDEQKIILQGFFNKI